MGSYSYSAFGVLVIGAYALIVLQGIEPFSASTVNTKLGAQQTGTGSSARARGPAFIWFGGFGGK